MNWREVLGSTQPITYNYVKKVVNEVNGEGNYEEFIFGYTTKPYILRRFPEESKQYKYYFYWKDRNSPLVQPKFTNNLSEVLDELGWDTSIEL